jgi:hypothetical protein
MKLVAWIACLLISSWVSGCGVYDSQIVECVDYPLRQTEKLIGSSDFEYLRYKKSSVFDPLRNDSQILMADSKFEFSTSYVLYLEYVQGSKNPGRHTEGCVNSSSLSLRYPFNEYQTRTISSYTKFLIENGMQQADVIVLQDALKGEVAYSQHGKLQNHRLFYGVSDHPVRGRFFKIDVKK